MSRAFPATLLLAVASLAAAGCVAPPADDPTSDPVTTGPSWAERALGVGDARHDHDDASHHVGLTTPNFQLLGWDPLVADANDRTAGGSFCGNTATTAEGRRLAVVNSFSSEVLFVLADVTDPAKPFKVGEFTVESALHRSTAYDVALTPDGKHVVASIDPEAKKPALGLALSAPTPWRLAFRDACTGETRLVESAVDTTPYGPGILLVGVQEPAKPVVEQWHPLPVMAAHSVSTAAVDGRQFVVASVTNVVHQASYFQFFEVVGSKLELLSVYQAPPPSQKAPIVNGHVDGTIGKHPITGKTLAYLAHWDDGVVILDMTDPRKPVLLSQFNRFSGTVGGYQVGDETGQIHGTLPIPGTWDGRHYVLAGQEILAHPADHPSGYVYIIDDTDPTKPTLAGKWTLPVDVEWKEDLQFSTHYFDLVGRTLFVAMYHGGLWAIDLSTPEAIADPPSLGVFVPSNVSPMPPAWNGHGLVGAPTVLEVLAQPDGTLVVFDGQSGVYTVRWDPTKPLAPIPTWDQAQG